MSRGAETHPEGIRKRPTELSISPACRALEVQEFCPNRIVNAWALVGSRTDGMPSFPQ